MGASRIARTNLRHEQEAGLQSYIRPVLQVPSLLALIAGRRQLSWPPEIAVGTPIAGRPRIDPSVRDSRTGLPPWVFDGEPPVRPWMKDSGWR